LRKYRQEGDLEHTYSPLKNLVEVDNSIVDFNTDELSIDLNNPLNIECQPSYDGTVNLIINDDKNPPKMINTRFSRLEDNKYRIINRNQLQQTNLYKEGKIEIPKYDKDIYSNIKELNNNCYKNRDIKRRIEYLNNDFLKKQKYTLLENIIGVRYKMMNKDYIEKIYNGCIKFIFKNIN
jgi:hypothetical protein